MYNKNIPLERTPKEWFDDDHNNVEKKRFDRDTREREEIKRFIIIHLTMIIKLAACDTVQSLCLYYPNSMHVSQKYKYLLTKAILPFCRLIPNGFFRSYFADYIITL